MAEEYEDSPEDRWALIEEIERANHIALYHSRPDTFDENQFRDSIISENKPIFIAMGIILSVLIAIGTVFASSLPQATTSEEVTAQEQVIEENQIVPEPEPEAVVVPEPEIVPEPEPEPEAVVVPEPESEVAEEAPVPTSEAPVNYDKLMGVGIVGLILLGIALLTAMGYGLYILSQKAKTTKQTRSDNERAWNNLLARYENVSKEWASYELDPVKILDLPLLSDMRETSTVNFHNALRKAKNLKPDNIKQVSHLPALDSVFASAVDNLENTFHIAEVEAKRTRWSHFSVEERKRLQRAKDLLSLAMNGAASEHERQSAYKRMQKEIEGLITIPDKTILALEEKMQFMLTDNKEASLAH